MPKSRVSKIRMFRESSKMKPYFLNKNYLKRLNQVRKQFHSTTDLSPSELDFLLWAYDLEFFTIEFAAKDYDMNKGNVGARLIFPLMNSGYIYKHFDKLSPSNQEQDMFFREENKFNYRVRYGLSQKGRLLVARFYRKMNGEEPFRLSSPAPEHQ